jgi:DNA-binding CsgD family transcriptional regulator
MASSDVSNRLVSLLAATAQLGGASPSTLFSGLSFTPTTGEEQPDGWVDWDEFAELCDRVEAASRGAEGFEALIYRSVVASPLVRAAASLFASPTEFYLVGTERLVRRLLRPLGLRAELLSDGRLRVEVRTPSGRHAGDGALHALHGCLRTGPRFFGLPDPTVEASFETRRVVFHITLNEPRRRGPTGPSGPSTGEQLAVTLRGVTRDPQPAHSPPPDLAAVLSDQALASEAAEVGQRWMGERNLGGLAELLAEFLSERLCCDRFALWVRPTPEGEDVLVAQRGKPSEPLTWHRPLEADARRIGLLSADVALQPDGSAAPLLEAALPWLGQAMRRGLRRPSSPLPGILHTVEADLHCTRWVLEWGLTPREGETLVLLARGRSNREIAEALGCSPRTVEAHVGRLLWKAGAESRSELLSRIFEP